MDNQNLQKALELVSQAGRLVATEGLESDPKGSDSFFEAITGLILSKKALQKIINEREIENCRYRGTPDWFRDAIGAGDSPQVFGGSGLDRRTEGSMQMSRAAQTHVEKPPQ